MALKSALESTKARLNALLTYANETTGESDTSIGDAIQTLCAGYGGGGVDHTIEDALLSGTYISEYRNDRINKILFAHLRGNSFGKVSFPNVVTLENDVFRKCNIEEIYCPSATSLGSQCFEGNPSLKVLAVPLIGAYRFRDCPLLSTLVLTSNTVSSPTQTPAFFGGTPFAPDGAGGYVYVPQALLSHYQSNSNWQQYANVLEFRPIEGSEYEISE